MVKSINEIIDEFDTKYNIHLYKLPRKKIIYANSDISLLVVMPYSKIYPRGNGWVDFTKKQIDLYRQYKYAISIFRLSNGLVYYVDLHMLSPLLKEENKFFNDREGEHWKLDIWSSHISPRKSKEILPIQANDSSIISTIVNKINRLKD